MKHDVTNIRKKKFTITVPPEYQGGRLLLLTSAEAKRVARGLMLDPDVQDAADPLLQWAEEVYYANANTQS